MSASLRMLTPAHSPQMALLSSVFLFFGGICAIAWHTSEKADDDELRVWLIASRAPPVVVECSRPHAAPMHACVLQGWGSTVVGLYCMALAIAIVAFEWKFGMQVPLVQDTRVPVRGIVQVGLSVFVFFSGPTIIPATTLVRAVRFPCLHQPRACLTCRGCSCPLASRISMRFTAASTATRCTA